MAAAIAYYALLSLLPLLILTVSVVSLVAGRAAASDRVAAALARALPVGGAAIRHALQHVSAGDAGSLGVAGFAGLAWTASGLFAAIRDAINSAFDIEVSRPLLRGKLVDLLMAAVTGGMLVASTVAVGAVRVLHHLAAASPVIGGIVRSTGPLWTLAAAASGFVIVLLMVSVLYTRVPATRFTVRTTWPGVLVGSVLLQATQYGLALYVGSISHYDLVYGSLATIVVFMVWVYVASLAILVGAEVAAEYPRVLAETDAPASGGDRRPAIATLRGLWRRP